MEVIQISLVNLIGTFVVKIQKAAIVNSEDDHFYPVNRRKTASYWSCFLQLDNISHYPSHQTVYNLSVETNHNYFVDEWYLVHNEKERVWDYDLDNPFDYEQCFGSREEARYACEKIAGGQIIANSFWWCCRL